MEKWTKYWGGDAEYDIAQEAEEIYESKQGKSATYWEYLGGGLPPSDNLDDRPEEYATCGYTSDFEGWGIRMVESAMDNGCETPEEVLMWMEVNG